MSIWRVGRVTVETDGDAITVGGVGHFAERLRAMSRGDSVQIVPPPGGSVSLRVDSDWLVDQWVRQWAAQMVAGSVTTDYEPDDDDIPDDARALLAARATDEPVAGRIY